MKRINIPLVSLKIYSHLYIIEIDKTDFLPQKVYSASKLSIFPYRHLPAAIPIVSDLKFSLTFRLEK
jgi:hypothetical protein